MWDDVGLWVGLSCAEGGVDVLTPQRSKTFGIKMTKTVAVAHIIFRDD